MSLKPLRDQVIVKPAPHNEMTKGGVYLPTQELPSEGEVIAVGTGALSESGSSIPLEVQVGDTVVFHKRAGTEVKIDDEKLLVLRESDILAVKQ